MWKPLLNQNSNGVFTVWVRINGKMVYPISVPRLFMAFAFFFSFRRSVFSDVKGLSFFRFSIRKSRPFRFSYKMEIEARERFLRRKGKNFLGLLLGHEIELLFFYCRAFFMFIASDLLPRHRGENLFSDTQNVKPNRSKIRCTPSPLSLSLSFNRENYQAFQFGWG